MSDYERIWLQAGTGSWEITGDVTWCQNKINDDDVEYVRVDLYAALKRESEEWRGKYEILEDIANSCDPSDSNEHYGTFDEVLAALSEEAVEFRKAFTLLRHENAALKRALHELAQFDYRLGIDAMRKFAFDALPADTQESE